MLETRACLKMSLPPNSDLTAEMEADYEEMENNRAEMDDNNIE